MMENFYLELKNQLGLHARASAKFVATASRFISKIEVSYGKHIVNGKSIMGIMMLGAKCGNFLECTAEGEDEQEIKAALTKLIENKFDEEN
jgi:phosphocarrier protein